MTYTLLNLSFLALAVVLAVVVRLTGRSGRPGPRAGTDRAGAPRNPRRAWVLAHAPLVAGTLTLVVLLVLAAVFDSLIVGVGLVAYDPARILGWYAGLAPVEDLAYVVGAVLVLPAVWSLLHRRDRRRSGSARATDARAGGAAHGAPRDEGSTR